MIEDQLFPVSPVDECAYLTELSTPFSFTLAGALTLDEITSTIVCEALDATLNIS